MKKTDSTIRFQLIRDEETIATWHNDLEIIYVLQGQGRLHLLEEKKNHEIQANDIFAVNSLQTHSIISSDDLLVLVLYIPQPLLLSVCTDMSYPIFELYSYTDSGERQQIYDSVRTAFAHAFNVYYKNESKYEIRMRSKVIQILDILVHNFTSEKNIVLSNSSGKSKLLEAMHYINENYNDFITLDEVAGNTSLTNTYLSRLFSRHMGQTFTEYLTSVRLYRASIMVCGDKTFTEIACEVGFSTTGSMITTFKKYYGMTPKEYRKKERENKTENKDFAEMETPEAFSTLLSYMEIEETGENNAGQSVAYNYKEIYVDATKDAGRIKQSWRHTVNAGYAKELLFADIQNQLKRFQSVVRCKYARVKGILDDDMELYDEDENGSSKYNFVLLDEALDFIISLDFTPYLCLNYIPGKLARKYFTHFNKTGMVSLPKDFDKWEIFIDTVVNHLMDKYGEDVAEKWIFSPYLSPNYMSSQILESEGYWKTYQCTHQILKKHGLTVISPIINISSKNTLELFLNGCKGLSCVPDRFSFTSLQIDYNETNAIVQNDNIYDSEGHIGKEEDYINAHYLEVRNILERFELESIPIYLDEWNNNFWQRDLANDTCFKSCYIFKNILENMNSFTGMSLLSIYDRYEEISPYPEVFGGGMGLFTRRGIEKAAFHAFALLSRMGTILLAQGDGYFISGNGRSVQIYLYNYAHYNKLYRHRYTTRLSMTDRYHVFNSKLTEHVTIMLHGLTEGIHSVRKWSVSTQDGSAYDEWVKMGAPEVHSREINQYLYYKGVPGQTYKHVECKENQVKLEIKVHKHEVILVEVEL